MKNAIILHGGYSTPKSFWYPSIQRFLEGRGYSVWVPQLPVPEKPDLTNWLPYVVEHGKFSESTILIGHSLGGALLLSVLEQLRSPVYKAIFVAAFGNSRWLKKESTEPMLKKRYNWKRMGQNARDIIIINSSADPWRCDEKQGLYLWKRLGGTLILRENEGHMGSDAAKQSYTRFYLLEKLLELTYSRQMLDGSDSG